MTLHRTSVDDPGRWILLDPLDRTRDGVESMTLPSAFLDDDDDDRRLEMEYGRCSDLDRPSMRKSSRHDSIM